MIRCGCWKVWGVSQSRWERASWKLLPLISIISWRSLCIRWAIHNWRNEQNYLDKHQLESWKREEKTATTQATSISKEWKYQTKPKSFSSRDCADTLKTLRKNGRWTWTLPHTSPMVTGAYRTATVKASKVAKTSFEVNVSTSQHMKRTWPKCLIGPVISEFPSVRWKNLSHCQELTCEKHLDPYFPSEAKQIWRTLPSKGTRSLAFLLNEYVGNIPPTCSKHPMCIPDTTRISTFFIRNPNLNLHWLLASLSGLSRSNKYPFKGSAPWKSKFSFDNFAKLPKNPSNKSIQQIDLRSLIVWYMLVDGLKRLDFLPVGTPRN